MASTPGERDLHLETLAVRVGGEPDAETGAVSPPLHLATTYQHAADGLRPDGLLYQRRDNPVQRRLEAALAALDGAARALFFGSGVSAATALLHGLPAGSRIVVQNDLYAGLRIQMQRYAERWQLVIEPCDLVDLDAAARALSQPTNLVWAESPSNPLLRVVDLARLARLAHAAGARLLVDGTFATPVLQRPIVLGADIVLHSATKYMGGHSDVMGGALCFSHDDGLAEAAFQAREFIGLHASPFAAWMVLRGLRSLPARMAWHCASADRIARFLADHPAVTAVHYPGLESHPGHTLARAQMSSGGGMLSFQVDGGRTAALAVAAATRMFINATSLGGCESLIEHRVSVEGPDSRTPPDLLRLSVGLEHADDLIADLDQALAAAR